MTDAAQLRKAIEQADEMLAVASASAYPDERPTDPNGLDFITWGALRLLRNNSQTLLTLIEAHGDGIQGLIEGTHEIKEKVISCGCNTDWSNTECPIITICEKHMTELADNYRNAKEG